MDPNIAYMAFMLRDAENIRQLFKILENFRMLASLAVNLSNLGSNKQVHKKNTIFSRQHNN